MNEMKTEDVMRALECWTSHKPCDEDCPVLEYEGSQNCLALTMENSIALLREKDADIKMLTEQNLALGEVVLKKDAEIERLQKIADDVADSFPVCEGCEGKTAFGERTEHCLYEIDDTFCAQRATKMWFALRGENEELHKEVERLKAENAVYANGVEKVAENYHRQGRAEAITEFAERLKAHECLPEYPWDEPFVLYGCIDQIAKEMKGN